MRKSNGGSNRSSGPSCCSAITDAQLKEAISKKAQELYEKSGRKPGRDMENWLKAEKMVKAQMCGDLKHMTC